MAVTEQMVRRALRGLTPAQHAVLRAVVTGDWSLAVMSSKRLGRCLQGLERRDLVRRVRGPGERWMATDVGEEVASRPAPAVRERTGQRG